MRRKPRTRAAIVRIAALLVLLLPVGLAGCGPTAEERLLHNACLALKAQDWDAYSRLTITEADYLLRQNRLDGPEAEGTFAEDSLRPGQIALLRSQYDRAVRGGPGQLDFSRCRYVYPELSRERVLETLSGEAVEVQEYRVEIEMDGPKRSAPGLGPVFVLARWEKGWRILALRYHDDR